VKVLVSGSTGLIGSALVSALARDGERVVRLVRSPVEDREAELRWDPTGADLDAGRLRELGPDAVVHLAGESIGGRWTAARKARIRDSRVQGTRLLSERIASLERRPGVLVCASAVGYYGDRGDEVLDESSRPGSTFLAQVTQAWEAAAEPARAAGIRVVNLRLGIVLSKRGGALGRMLPLFRLGLGGPLGSGRQYMSWVALDDVVDVIRHALVTATLDGPVNTASPNPVTNREFARTLGRVLGRPAVMPAPAFALRLVLGELGGELLGGQRVDPGRLLASGYEFRNPQLEPALRAILDKGG
jgi:uncharacterized protein (TIGR01777 family)